MADIVVKEVREPEQKRLMISHCNCPERAELVEEYDIIQNKRKRDSDS